MTRPSPRYLAILVGGAILVLSVGASLRPKTRQATVVPSNELATLPERSQRRSLRDMAEYVAERANAVGASIYYLPEFRASALALGRDSVLSVSTSTSGGSVGRPSTLRFVVVTPSAGDSLRSAARAIDVDTLPPRWGLVVARAEDGQTLSLAGLTGGLVPVRCGDLELRELVFGAVVPRAFAGGGVFDLDGNAMALAVPCGGRVALVPLTDVRRALER